MLTLTHAPRNTDLKFSPNEVADVGSKHWSRVKQDLLAQVFFYFLLLFEVVHVVSKRLSLQARPLGSVFFFKPVSDFFLTCVYFLYLFLWGPSTGSRVRENLLAQVCVCVGAWVRGCVGGEEKDGPLILCPLHYIDVPYRYVGVS